MKRDFLSASVRTRLAALATADSEFRSALVADPRATVQANFQLPPGTTLRVVEAPPGATCIVIPQRPTGWPAGLSAADAQKRLEQVMSPQPAGLPEISRLVLSVIAKAMTDNAFAASLIADPVSALRTAGIDAPNDVSVIVVQEAPGESIIIVPAEPPAIAPRNDDLDDTAVFLHDSMMQTQMSNGSWPFTCSNPPTWCPSCMK